MTPNAQRVAPAYLTLFALLYALQGGVVAYLFNFNVGYMTAAGVSLTVVGRVQALALLPMVLKFLAGPVSDRFNLFGLGHRRPYIGLGILGQSTGLIGLALVNPSRQLVEFTVLAILVVTGLGLYDTCCDGMVVDMTPSEDRARVQGILWATRFLAAMLCTLGFGLWLDRLGGARHADRLLLACAAMGLPPMALVVWLAEPSRASDAEVFAWSALKTLIRPWSLALLTFGGLYGLTGLGVEANLSPFYADKGFGDGENVGVLGFLRYLGRAIGALVLPLAMLKLGRRRSLSLGVAVLAATIGGQAWVDSRTSAAVFAFGFGVANGWCDALFGVLAMDAADPRLAASTFALFMAVTNLSVLGTGLFTEAVSAFGGRFAPAFGLAAVLALATWPLTIPLGRRAPRSESPE